jgi:hypothetical protein
LKAVCDAPASLEDTDTGPSPIDVRDGNQRRWHGGASRAGCANAAGDRSALTWSTTDWLCHHVRTPCNNRESSCAGASSPEAPSAASVSSASSTLHSASCGSTVMSKRQKKSAMIGLSRGHQAAWLTRSAVGRGCCQRWPALSANRPGCVLVASLSWESVGDSQQASVALWPSAVCPEDALLRSVDLGALAWRSGLAGVRTRRRAHETAFQLTYLRFPCVQLVQTDTRIDRAQAGASSARRAWTHAAHDGEVRRAAWHRGKGSILRASASSLRPDMDTPSAAPTETNEPLRPG